MPPAKCPLTSLSSSICLKRFCCLRGTSPDMFGIFSFLSFKANPETLISAHKPQYFPCLWNGTTIHQTVQERKKECSGRFFLFYNMPLKSTSKFFYWLHLQKISATLCPYWLNHILSQQPLFPNWAFSFYSCPFEGHFILRRLGSPACQPFHFPDRFSKYLE